VLHWVHPIGGTAERRTAMAEQERAEQQTEPGQQQEPPPTSRAAATEELSDAELDAVAGGFGKIEFEYKPQSE
jgi:hypothetical protein